MFPSWPAAAQESCAVCALSLKRCLLPSISCSVRAAACMKAAGVRETDVPCCCLGVFSVTFSLADVQVCGTRYLQEAEGGALAGFTGTMRYSSGLIADQKRTAAALVRVSKMMGKVRRGGASRKAAPGTDGWEKAGQGYSSSCAANDRRNERRANRTAETNGPASPTSAVPWLAGRHLAILQASSRIASGC